MKIRTVENKAKDESEMNLSLVDLSNSVKLVGLDSFGESWAILEITKDGIVFYTDIPENTGWPVDEKGKIKVVYDRSPS